jgi:glycosyltransferase involved in cell wall biosynthesis
MEPFPIVYGKRLPGQKSIGVIHHIDHRIAEKSIYHRWFFSRLLSRLKKCDGVVTVSEHWKEYFDKLGCKNVQVIYNSFDPSLYGKMDEAEMTFRQRHEIPLNKKIIYIGNAIKEKGVVEVYDALKNSEYHLIMTGPRNRVPELNVQYLNLKREDYLRLLTVSSVVICFSLMEEGWNRIAHEALLSGTPVIGTGSGGMRELLEKSGQLIVTDKMDLKNSVDQIMKDRAEYSRKGLQYVRQFDLAYFSRSWIGVVQNVLGENKN